ncbi:MAG TPA: hypothetical protein VL463_16880 [Kofleriaceae bacterium]|nr:hypothetical protein [Kofleriaceae bacterium]
MRRAILPWIVVGAAFSAACGKAKDSPAPAPNPAPKSSPPPAPAPAKPKCAPLPGADTDHEVIEADLDGDKVADQLVPTDCDGRDDCTLHVFLVKDGCPTPLGDLEMVRGKPDVLPLTSRGVALIHTDSAVHAETDETVYAWTGTQFVSAFEGCTYAGPAHDGEPCTGGVTPDAAQLCLGGGAPSATFDVDGDGQPDGAFDVPCDKDTDSHACGSWILLSRQSCLVPAMVLPPGKIDVATPAAHGKPARLKVGKDYYQLPAPK